MKLSQYLREFVIKQWCLPYRTWLFLENNFPFICYFLRNLNKRDINTKVYWDKQLDYSWADPKRDWPTKNLIISQMIKSNSLVLDCGCGTGSLLRLLRKDPCLRRIGLELSFYSIQKLKTYDFDLINASLPFLPIKSGVMDYVILSEVLEHIVRQKYLLKEMHRIILKDGALIVTVPDDCLGPMTEKEHVRKYNVLNLTKLLSKWFKVTKIVSFVDINHDLPTLIAISRKKVLP